MAKFRSGDLIYLLGSKSYPGSEEIPIFIIEYRLNTYTYYWIDKPNEIMQLDKKSVEGDFLCYAKDQDKDW